MHKILRALIIAEAVRRGGGFDQAIQGVWRDLERSVPGPLLPVFLGERLTDRQAEALGDLLKESPDVLREAHEVNTDEIFSEPEFTIR